MKKKLAIILSVILACMSLVYMNQDDAEASYEETGNEEVNLNLSADQLVNRNELTGWASVSGEGMEGVTGGGNATPEVVYDIDQLRELAAGNTPRVIVIAGYMVCYDGLPVYVGNNKTIVGIDRNAYLFGGFQMEGVCNVIISNLNIVGNRVYPEDCISTLKSHHLWFNHLNIFDGPDGNMDLTTGSNYITVSWCKFWYSYPKNHRLNSLVGSGGTDHDDTDMGKLKVTYHHNWFGDLITERMPRYLYGKGHIYNNYYTAEGNNICIGVGDYASVLIENNYFKNVKNPHIFIDPLPANITARGNAYDNTTGSQDTGSWQETSGYVQPFTDPPYDYEMDDASDVPEVVMNNVGPKDILNATPAPSKTPKPSASSQPTETPTQSPSPTPSLSPQVTDHPITYNKDENTYEYHGENSDGSNAFYNIENPFKGLNLDETLKLDHGYPTWKKGVTISYWVYVPSDATDAAILNFNLKNDRQMYCKDKVKYNICQAYSELDSTYAMGTSQVYIDANGKEYTVLSGYGSNVCYNPNYPKEGCYEVDFIQGAIPVYPKGSDKEDTSTWTYIKYIGEGMYDYYGKKYDEAGGQDSRIGEANISGSLSIYASGSVGFRQDNLTGLQLNPNLPDYNHITPIEINNQLYYFGNGSIYSANNSELTPTMEQKGQWHFVVAVLQNDWIQFYMDGKEINLDYLNYWGDSPFTDAKFQKYMAGRTFNLGFGNKMNYMSLSPLAEDANSMTLMDFITNEKTVLTIGGQGFGANRIGQNTIGTPNGVKVKDVHYYDEPMEASSIENDKINTQVKPLNVMLGDVDGNGMVELSDAQMGLKAALNITSLDTDAFYAADIDGNKSIDLTDAQKILKAALNIETLS